jgi:hypothetical protein
MNLLPLLFLLQSRFGIYLPPEKFLLAQKLPPAFDARRIQRSRAQRRQHRASRLPFMTAIPESAPRRQRINIGKNLRNAVPRIPQLHLAQPRRVDQLRPSESVNYDFCAMLRQYLPRLFF